MRDLFVSFATVFLAELADKSQLVVIALAAVYATRQILIGVVLSAALTQTLSVGVGAWLGEALPRDAVLITSGLAFVGFGLLTLRGRAEDESAAPQRGRRGVLAVAFTVFVAELGDKTMVATAALSATSSAIAVWLGSFVALVTSAGLALVVGSRTVARLPRDRVTWLAAGLFIAWGAVLLVSGLG